MLLTEAKHIIEKVMNMQDPYGFILWLLDGALISQEELSHRVRIEFGSEFAQFVDPDKKADTGRKIAKMLHELRKIGTPINKVQAIITVRTAFDMGLPEAKDLVEEGVNTLGTQYEPFR